MNKQMSGRVKVSECIFTLIFFAAVIHIVALVFGIPISTEVFDTLR